MAKRFSLGFSLFLVASDLIIVNTALYLATVLRMTLPFGMPVPTPEHFILPWPVYPIASVVWLTAFIVGFVYDPKHIVKLINELQTIIQASALAWLMLAGFMYLTFRDVSRLQMVYFGAIVVLLIALHRVLLRGYFRLAGGRKSDARHVLIIGTGAVGREVGRMVRQHAWAGLYLVGYAGPPPEHHPLPAPHIGEITTIEEMVSEHHINEVVIALPSDDQLDIRNLVYGLQYLPLNIRVVPDYFDLAFFNLQVEDFGGMPLLSLKEPTLTPLQRLTKRIFDAAVVSIGMIFALPLVAVIAVAIKLDDPGPVFYRQKRVGEGGDLFDMLKFRTMVVGADEMALEVATQDEYGNVIHKRPDDPRVTRVGQFLRRTSLDELPQIFNILKGEMSLVGPRPEMPWLVEKYEPWQHKRFHVPQGLTGWWQINGRSDKPMHMHTEEDLFYIRNYSLWLDIQILWRTVGVVLSGRGAY